MTNTTAALGIEPRTVYLRPESEMIEASKGTTDTARRECIERRAWELYLRDPKVGMYKAIELVIMWDAICEEML
jgi:hypothetical protein